MTSSASRAQSIDTKSVKDRPDLRFASVDDILACAARLAAAERAGSLVPLGNWTLGQCFSHLATWAEFPFDGYPPGLKPPLLLKLMLGLLKGRLLKGKLGPGYRIPGTPDGTLGAEKVSTDAGLRRLQAAMLRLKATAPTLPNPLLGRLAHGEWLMLQCRHAELHMSFFRPG